MGAPGGEPDCGQCGGAGTIGCVVCGGTGSVTMTLMMDTTSSSQCRMCRGRSRIPCPSCRAVVYKSVVWWDKIPDDDEDEEWRKGDDGSPRMPWSPPPA
ncbi:hypothetical protein I4F81_011607 [Pyropia yezoensis]|uniref:Uncharacterized protein n=1 Tax=Pyropia yezoensis TaxID=2788 RepID=A0ACC3CGA7_PYRYE|nr:hypothetical protein I4F81_011607 [Neopyropia yezoensis]